MKPTARIRLLGMTGIATLLMVAGPAIAADAVQERKAGPQDGQDGGARPGDTLTGASPSGPAPDADTQNAEVEDSTVATGEGEIVVTGLRRSLRRAVDIKRNADNIVDSIVADDIGKLPDQNIAEAIQRIPGVTISRDNGEGQFITVRGLGPAFSTALYNGRILATENQGREFSFDILPAELINRVDVSKTPTSTQTEGGIASTVDLYTARPFDFRDGKFSLTGQANYDKLRGKFSPQASGLFSTTFADGRFGILAAFSYLDRKIEGQRIFTDGFEANQRLDFNKDGTPEFTGVSLPTYTEFGVNSTNRKRLSGLLTAQYAPSDTIVLTLDGLYSKLDVNDDNKAFFVFGGPGDITAATVDANNTVTSFTGLASGPYVVNQVRPRLAKTYQTGANLKWDPSARLTTFLDLSWSKSTDDTGGNQAYFEANLAGPNYSPARVQYALGPNGKPAYSGLGDILDTSNARVGYVTLEGVSVSDEVYQANSQARYDFDGGFLRFVSAGLNYSDRKKERFSTKTPNDLQSLFGGTPIPPSIFGQPADSENLLGSGLFVGGFPTLSARDIQAYLLSEAGIAATPNPAATRAALAANGGTLDVIPVANNSGSAQERTIGGFVQAAFGGDLGTRAFSGNIGVRATRTKVISRGFGQEILSITTPPGLDPVVNLSPAQAISQRGSYSAILPSANFKIDVIEDLVFQAAVARTLTRATLSDLLLIRDINPRPRERSIRDGNPGLEPFTAWNYDAALTYYLGRSSFLSVAVFKKDIKNLSENVTSDIQILGLDFRRTRPENVGNDTIKGIELSGQYTFDGLPAPFDGLGVQANYSLVDPSATTYNLVAFYEKGPLQARIAYNYRDSYEISSRGRRGQPENAAAYGIADASINYAIDERFTVFAQGLNLFNEKTHQFSVFKERTILFETFGPRYALGLRANF